MITAAAPIRWVRLVALLPLLGVSLLCCGPRASGGCPAPSVNTPGEAASRLPLRSLCVLPPQAAQVWHLIATGDTPRYPPAPYSHEGIVFDNAEQRLPREPRGYYHEYTVPTPGERGRGSRRLITGRAHELYYTGDHYHSFVVVDPTAVAG